MTREENLEKALEAVAERESAYGTILTQHAEAESEYRVRQAKAYLAAEGTEKARQAIAIVETERFLRERDRLEALREFMRESLRDSQAAVSAHQSLLSSEIRTTRAFTGGTN